MLNKVILFRLNNIQLNNRIAFLANMISIMLCVISIGYYIVTNWFKIDRIIIDGNMKHITSSELENIANNKLHGTFFTLNIAELQDKFDELVWVQHVSVQRVFPNKIVVKLQEYDPVAKIDGIGILSRDGQVFNAVDSESLPLFMVKLNNVQEAYQIYSKIKPIVEKHSDEILSLKMDNPRVLEIKTKNHLNVVFCQQNLDDKIKNLDIYWDKLNEILPGVNSINFCYKDAVAISVTHN
ncbi:MAG: FtsQ-type POTRA domain-containing protein [Burkholderiales bacterium]|nr:FtsQ-type POTRA domain-containing protein [Burkholderiales bacterium]